MVISQHVNETRFSPSATMTLVTATAGQDTGSGRHKEAITYGLSGGQEDKQRIFKS